MLSGCEEGDHDVLHFVYKENTQDIPKVLDAIKKHDYMECFGKPRLNLSLKFIQLIVLLVVSLPYWAIHL